MSRPWMPLYVADYLADTRRLSTLEHGAYLLLLMDYWQVGSLPDDDGRLARIAGLSQEEWAQVRPALRGLFGEGWRHGRVEAELRKAASISESRRAAAHRRHNAAPADASADANAPAKPMQKPTQARALPQSQVPTPPVGPVGPTAPTGADAGTDDEHGGPEPSLLDQVQEADPPTPDGPEPRDEPKRGKRLPETWSPRAEERTFALELGFDANEVDHAAAEFRDYWLSESGQRARKLDWDRTFRNRLRELAARRRRAPAGGPAGAGGSRPGGVVAAANRVLSQLGHG